MNAGQDRFRVFISHSHVDKEIAGLIKSELLSYGANAFVAHEDISPTEQWQDTIIEVLKECDVFIALYTRSFENSNWTDQETGFALALGKKIITVKIDIDPYGFVGKFQALKWKPDAPLMSLDELIGILGGFGVISKQDLITGFSNSHSFIDAARKSAILLRAAPFTKEEINNIILAAIRNSQIYGSWDAQANLNALVKAHERLIDPALLARLASLH